MSKDARDFIDTALRYLPLVKVTEGNVQNGAIFRGVDVLAREHLVAESLELCLAHEIEEGGENGLGDQVLGEIEEEGDIGAVGGLVFATELGEPFRILSKQILENKFGLFGVVDLLQLLPRRVF